MAEANLLLPFYLAVFILANTQNEDMHDLFTLHWVHMFLKVY